ncbi:hypothetical protein B0H13DRAFT_2064313 [Mycena leptocephala]|nr:hypothetical protein B0H13DRAFT_2064313 [Mycena leptocephala]
MSHYRPIGEEDARLRGPLRTVTDNGLKVGRKVCHGLGANRSGDCNVNGSEPPAAAQHTSFPSRRAVSSSDKSWVLSCSSHPPRFEPCSGALASTACVFRARHGASVGSASRCFGVGIGGVGIDIRLRSTHAGAVESPVGAASVAVLVLAACSSVLPPSRSGTQPASSSHLRWASRLPALSTNAKSANPLVEGVEDERGELEGHIVRVVLAS